MTLRLCLVRLFFLSAVCGEMIRSLALSIIIQVLDASGRVSVQQRVCKRENNVFKLSLTMDRHVDCRQAHPFQSSQSLERKKKDKKNTQSIRSEVAFCVSTKVMAGY